MDVVTIGDCVLYHADCLEVLPTLAPGSVDAVVTDPPYGIGGYVSSPSKWRREKGLHPEAWDDSIVDLRLIMDFGVVAIWGGNNYSLPPSRGWLCWIKPDAPPSMATIELCWTNQDQNAKHVSWSIGATNAERTGHPTQKPLRVMLWTIEQLPPRQTILDPFMGSGTTGVACVRLGRKFIGVEVEEKYFRIAVRRIEQAYADRANPLFGEVAPKPVQQTIELKT